MLEARKSALFEALFGAYTVRLLRRSFHRIHLAGGAGVEQRDRSLPLLFFGNHSSWWDALLPLFLSRRLFHLDSYAMMEERQLAAFPFFRRIGVFSVNRESPKDVARSIRYAQRALRGPGRALWMYPQGKLLPAGMRPLTFQRGIGHIIGETDRLLLVPFAVRYEFRGERYPEIFISIGAPFPAGGGSDGTDFMTDLEQRVTQLLDGMNEALARNELAAFDTVLVGRSSPGRRQEQPGAEAQP